MDYSTQSLSSYNDFQGLARLRAQAQRDQGAAIDQVAGQFEGMFLQMMLKEMRKTVPESVFFNSPASRLFQDMQDQQVALEMAKDGPLGLADMLKAGLAQTPRAPRQDAAGGAFPLGPAEPAHFGLHRPERSLPIAPARPVSHALNAYQVIGQER